VARCAAGAGQAIAVLLLAGSCGTSSEITSGPSAVKCGLQIQAESTGFPSDGGSGTLNITASRECTWSAQTDASWLALTDPSSGQGSGSLRFTVARNGDPAVRSGHIRVQDQQLEISQRAAACDLRISSDHESVGPSGGTRTIRVSASSPQCTWTAVSNTSWITIANGGSGRGDGAAELRVAASNGPSRTGSVTIAGRTLTVEQSAEECAIAVDPQAFTIPATGGRGVIRVNTRDDCRWSASSDSAARGWIDVIAGDARSGSGEVQFTVQPREGLARTGHIQIADQTVTVSQGSNCTLSVEPATLNVGPQQTVQSVRVDTAAGCGWTAVSDASWIVVSAGASGAGGGPVDLAIAANQGPARTGSVAVGGQTVSVTQAGGCTYSVSPETVDLTGQGGAVPVSVATAEGCSWTATSQAAWIDLSVRSGAGPAQVQILTPVNASPARSGTVTIAGRPITVNQASTCTFAIVPQSLDYTAAGGFGAVLVIVPGGCSWTAASGAAWITMTVGESGAGDGHIEFAVAPNTGPARSGWVTVAGLRVTVTQSAP
jgi:hypothetical protein